ncbi:MAG TPA: hypothetical protein VN925_02315 [Steroidobacteraceae bacterium]|nr:hypothetical protein [Steroidobacteraceae bacterium]
MSLGAQLAALKSADYQTIAALDGGPAAESFESHGLNPCLPAKYSYNVAPVAAQTPVFGGIEQIRRLAPGSDNGLQV